MAENRDRQEVQQRGSPTGTIVYHAVTKEGEGELSRRASGSARGGLGYAVVTRASVTPARTQT